MKDHVLLCVELPYYIVVYNGLVYEVVNKVTNAIESSQLALPPAIGDARAFNKILTEYAEIGLLTEDFT